MPARHQVQRRASGKSGGSEPARVAARLIDVATHAGVSRTAASKVLLGTGGPNTRVSEITAQRIRDAARTLDFRPNRIAQQLKGARSGLLGLVVGFGASPILHDRLVHFEREAYERGYRLLPGHAHGDAGRAEDYVRDLFARGVEAMIVVHFNPVNLQRLENLHAACPVVYQCQFSVPDRPSITLDRAAGIRHAVHHLAGMGRRRIGILAGLVGPANEPRLQGYRRAHEELDRPVDSRLIWTDIAPYAEQTDYDRVIDDLIEDARADAVFANNDMAGVLLIKALRRRGLRVPEDVAVVGFDNLDIAAVCEPQLTSIDQCNARVAHLTIDYALRLAGGEAPASLPPRWVEPRLVVRASTGG